MTTLAETLAVREAALGKRGFRVRAARLADVPRMAEMINNFAGQGEMLPRRGSASSTSPPPPNSGCGQSGP